MEKVFTLDIYYLLMELVNWCSGVRRAAGGTSSSQLHQLQMELQLQRQQAQVSSPFASFKKP